MRIDLTRQTSTGKYIPEIDGLRFFAIVPVVIWHLALRLVDMSPDSRPDQLYVWLGTGAYGVEIFFIISGFVLLLPYAHYYNGERNRPSIRSFYLRRITRLEPPYLIAFVGIGVLQLMRNTGDSGRMLAGIFYSNGFVYGDLNPLMLIAWTLEIEIQFYLLVPLLGYIFSIRNSFLRRIVVIVGALLLSLAEISLFNSPADMNVFGYILWFGTGILLVDFFVNDWKTPSTRPYIWFNVSIVSSIALLFVFRYGLPIENYLVNRLAPQTLAFCSIVGVFRSPILGKSISWKPISIIGGMAYSIYLLHYTIIALLPYIYSGHSNFKIALALSVLPTGAMVFFISAVFFVLIERPCMDPDWASRMKDRINKNRRLG